MNEEIKLEAPLRLRSLVLNKKLSGVLLVGYVAVGVLMALFVPLDVLGVYPWASSFVDGMGVYIPAIKKLSTFSELPGLARFHMAVLWALSPVIVIPMVLGSWMQPQNVLDGFFKEARLHRFRTLLTLIVPPFLLCALYLLSPGGAPGMQLSVYLGSRSGLAIWTFIILGVFVFFSLWLGILKVIRTMLRIVFFRNFDCNMNMSSSLVNRE